jgi:predicted nucleotidyltransferase
MDFDRVLRDLILDFTERGVRYALIGGFAMGALGIARATMDLDFLVRRDDLATLDSIMDRRLYRLAYRSENVSQYVSDLALLGQVDFLHAFRLVSTSMLGRAREIDAFGGSLRVRTLPPEDIIGLKVQALANDPLRELQEIVDIRLLAERFGPEMEWGRIREYFALFDRMEMYDELRQRYGSLEQG